ncbi:MAG: serine/threonine-protein kinase [Betaproteobacteria bacterium]|nr:serine/threonine-protein kinase [Betaproteobacteria bacterium]MCL2885537.1 serine/threonine-protein kinase [Betaproteobacteria bacterium]
MNRRAPKKRYPPAPLPGGDSALINRQIGKYELMRKLGSGFSSTVYLAHDPFTQRDVAIKIASPDVLRDPDKGRIYSQLFLNEASLVGKLNHPHIVQIYDAVVSETACYIVMEYIAGGTLERHASPSQLLPVDRVVELIFKCTRALEFAHRLDITHRDIKPANILMTSERDIKIGDFGAALTGLSRIAQVGAIGSPAYMSPEQVQELPLDHRTDIYSLGVVLFQLLTGHLPFQAEDQADLVYRIAHEAAPRAASLRPDLPPALDAIVARAMAKEREQRYQNWQDLAQDLANTVLLGLLPNARHDFPESERFHILRTLPFFTDFSDAELWEVLRFAQWRRVAPGDLVLHEGDPGNAFSFVAAGQLTVSKGDTPLDVLCHGDCFGEMAVLNRQVSTRSADVIALTESDIVTISGKALEQASDACRLHFYQGFIDVLVNRLNIANQRLAGA